MITNEMKKYDIKDIKEQHFKAKSILMEANEKEMQQIKLSIPDRSYDILCKYHGINQDSNTIESIAKEYGVTRERINQIIRKSEITIIAIHENIDNEDKLAFENLSIGTKNSLKRYMKFNYNKCPESIKDITILTVDEIKTIRHIGIRSLEEIIDAVISRGYELKAAKEDNKDSIEHYFKSFEFSLENSILKPLKAHGVSTIQDLRNMTRKETEDILHDPIFVDIAVYIANCQDDYEL